jgi:hypothetical protein
MGSQDQPKKPYSSPTLTKMTREQAKKLVMDRKHCSEEEADKFLNSLRQQAQRTGKDRERKRSA